MIILFFLVTRKHIKAKKRACGEGVTPQTKEKENPI